MLLDEEAILNQQSRMPPPGAQPPGPPAPATPQPPAGPQAAGKPRPATPEERKMLDKLLRQSLLFLTSEQSAEHLIGQMTAGRAKPAEVLAEAVSTVVLNAVESAAAAGVQLPTPVRGVTVKAAVVAMSMLLAKAGVVRDPASLAREVMATLKGGGGGQPAPQPAQQPAPGVA